MELSVIIPVYNGGNDFLCCLGALHQSPLRAFEIIVVDDGSTDSSAQAARQYATKVIELKGSPKGPAFARNVGALAATGNILLFLDADIMIHEDTLDLIEGKFMNHPELAAVFGSYDDIPSKIGFVSQYKNLQHHFVHQHGRPEATTFWAGCGAIRRNIFLQFGGFNISYTRPSIEDIELGLRLTKTGYRISLCRDILVTHLKQWSFLSLLKTDIFQRAVPWTQLILSSSEIPSDLNLNLQNRLSVLAVWIFITCLFLGLFQNGLWLGTLAGFIALILLNYEFYYLCFKRGGMLLSISAVGLHSLYFCYSSLTFLLLMIINWVSRFITRISLFVPRKKEAKEQPKENLISGRGVE